jgi:hypothetical protein
MEIACELLVIAGSLGILGFVAFLMTFENR